jgi:hypothetical protein
VTLFTGYIVYCNSARKSRPRTATSVFQFRGDSFFEAPSPRLGDAKNGPGCAPDATGRVAVSIAPVATSRTAVEQAVLGGLPPLNPAQRRLFQASAACAKPAPCVSPSLPLCVDFLVQRTSILSARYD